MKLIIISALSKIVNSNIMKTKALTTASFLFLFFSCDYNARQEYEIENNLSSTLFVKITNTGCGLSKYYSSFVNDSVKPYSTKVVFIQDAGISTYPEADDYTCIKELCIYTLNGNDTIKSHVDYSKNQNMEYYFRNKTTGVYLIRVDSSDFSPLE